MKTITLLFSIIAMIVTSVFAEDLTTYERYVANGGTVGRYLVNLGNFNGDTAIETDSTSGLFDYPKYRGTAAGWYVMNDGEITSVANTERTGDTGDEFVGYMFKTAASVSNLVFTDYSYSNNVGGRFSATPDVQVLNGSRAGSWSTVSATWDTPYDTTQTNGASATYTITLDALAEDVWGVRLNGPANAGTTDPSGFIGVRELQVNGSIDWNNITLEVDLAMADDGTEIWNHRQYPGVEFGCTIDGDIEGWTQTTWWGDYLENNVPPHWFGVMWDAPKNDVAAVGWVMRMFPDGGWFEKDSITVEYAEISGGSTNWVEVSNLDASPYNDMIDTLIAFRTGATDPGNFDTGFLFQFDPVDDIYGIRIKGEPGGTAGYDSQGFVAAKEFEVFQQGALLPPVAPALSLPNDNDIITNTMPTFVWQAAQLRDGSSIVEYELVVGADTYSGLSTTNYTLTTPLSLGDYEWKVRAKDDNDNWSAFSTPYTLTIVSGEYDPDLTTFHQYGMNGVMSRYLVNLGRNLGDTARDTTATTGIYDEPKVRGNSDAWWVMNDGKTETGHAVTFLHDDDLFEWNEFYGYKFKRRATVESIELTEYSFIDGGPFSTNPTVQVLVGGRSGTWTNRNVTWNPPYDPEIIDGTTRFYTVTFDTPQEDVWGVRFYGLGWEFVCPPDPSGFVACREMRLLGSVDWNDLILEDNIAYMDTASTQIMNHANYPMSALNDGNIGEFSYTDTFGAPTNLLHYFGVMWDVPQDDVAGAGWVLRINPDGGWFEKNSVDVEYATISGGATNWTSVSNLDLSSYNDDLEKLIYARTNSAYNLDTGFLFTFNAVSGINGLRISGQPGGAEEFVSIIEFEAFRAIPEPAIGFGIAALACAFLRRIRK